VLLLLLLVGGCKRHSLVVRDDQRLHQEAISI
jgi:hypothetical protein